MILVAFVELIMEFRYILLAEEAFIKVIPGLLFAMNYCIFHYYVIVRQGWLYSADNTDVFIHIVQVQ